MSTGSTALLKSIAAYVPDLLLERVLEDPAVSLAGWEERLRAAFLFADVSGFTAMSENLARLGKEGAEELTRVLGVYFADLIERVHSYGGHVVKFGGDALTCAFPGDGEALLRACACGLAMQEASAAFRSVETRGGVFALRMKAGISAGPALFMVVGDEGVGLEYVLAGYPLDRMAEAEHHASPGEVVVDRRSLAGEGNSIALGETRGEYRIVQGVTASIPPAGREEPDWEELSPAVRTEVVERLVVYLPPTVYESLVEGQRSFVGEHRRAVSLFVNFSGLDYDDDPSAGRKLQAYFTTMQGIIHRYGGRLNRLTTGDKGSLLHLIFGAPVAYEDNEERAVGCALEMQARAQDVTALPFVTDQRMGIASGPVFAGNVGSRRRREYTVMGATVNLSARLMQAAAPGSIWMDRRTAERVASSFECRALEPVRVKGREEPVAVYEPLHPRRGEQAWASAAGRRTPLVGRAEELARVERILDAAAAGQGRLLVLTGEAGVGKSRLLEELIARAHAQEFHVLGGNCLSYGSQSPYLPWIALLHSLFDLRTPGGEVDGEERVQRIERGMAAADPALADWVPLIAQLLGLPVPDSPLTAVLDAQLRKQRTFDILLQLLRHRALDGPLLVVFEDVHWIDEISLELLNHVARNVAPLPLLLAALHRPTIELQEWTRYHYAHRIELGDLPAGDALELVRLKLGMDRVPDPLRERIVRDQERVNPFFVEEVVNALIDRGYLVAYTDGGGYELVGDLATAEIPDSVQTLVMSRIDRLDESSKLTVKVASVIGRTFRYRTLESIYPVTITSDRLQLNLERLNRLDLTPLDRPAPDWEYIFKHVITQEVAYESLLYAHRRDLHRRVGMYLERMYPTSREEVYELLAHHYYRSGNAGKAWRYLVAAGDRARDQYAGQSAITHYTHALALVLERDDAYRVHASLADVYRLTGRYEKALDHYNQALALSPPGVEEAAGIRRRMAKVWELQGQYDEALAELERARAVLLGEPKTREMAHVYSTMGWVAVQRGQFEQALQWCEKGLVVAAGLPADEATQRARAELQHTQGSAYLRTGDYPQAIERFRASIETREQIGDLPGMSASYNNLAVIYWSQSRYDLAKEVLEKSLEIDRRIGNPHGMAMDYNNLGVLAYTLGDGDRAVAYYERSLEIRREIGDLPGIADVHNNLGEVYHSRGDPQRALEYLRRAVEMYTDLGNREAVFDAYRLLAEVELDLEDGTAALEHCRRALEVAHEIGNREYEGVAQRVLGQIERAAGRLEEARRCLEASVEALEEVGNRLELGRALYELGRVLQALGREGGEQALERAESIFEELGLEAELEKTRTARRDV